MSEAPAQVRWYASSALWVGLAASLVCAFTLVPSVAVALALFVVAGTALTDRPRWLCAVALLFAGFFVVRDLTSGWRRPMFHNLYSRNDCMIWSGEFASASS